MEIQEYKSLMQSVSEFAGKIGLNNNGLYRDSYEHNSEESPWVISVSWKDKISNSSILCNPKEVDPNTRFRLEFPMVVGSESEIREFARRAEEIGAEFFTKKSVARDGFVEPSPSFLELGIVKQVEYALHEAFHVTTKDDIFGEVQQYRIPRQEETYAMIAGHLGAIYYFKGTDQESKAVFHWQKHLDLANKVKQFHQILTNLYSTETSHDSLERILQMREEVFLQARISLGHELGEPVNNAFFLYWNYFYGDIPKEYQRVSKLENIGDIIKRLRGKRI